MKAWYIWTVALSLCVSSCKLQEFEEPVLPASTGSSRTYPFTIKYKENLAGTITLSQATGSGVVAEIKLGGLVADSRYFGKVATRSGATLPYIDVADLGEISRSGEKRSWLEKDYSGRLLSLEDFTEKDVVIRILEIQSGQLLPTEVLRAEIGSNEILPAFRVLAFKATSDSSFNGSLKIQQRKSGNWIGKITFPNAINASPSPLILYRGTPEPGQFSKWEDIGQISPSADTLQVQIPFGFDSFSGLDTLRGFLGLTIPHSNPDSVSFLSIINFGGNQGTGRSLSYPIYNTGDSSVAGNLFLEEVGSAGAPLKCTFTSLQAEATGGKYLSLHFGALLEPSDTLWTARIPANGVLNTPFIKLKTGEKLTYDGMLALEGNFRITNDLQDYSTPIAGADAGANQLDLSDSLVVQINQPNAFAPTPGISGTVVFKRRKNGQLLASIALTDRQAFATNSLVIRQGPKPGTFNPADTTETRLIVSKFEGTNGGGHKSLANPTIPGGTKATWANLQAIKQSGAYIELYFDDGGELYILSRGDL